MRRLGEDFSARQIASLPPSSWQMLETMLRAPASGVRRELDGQPLAPAVDSTSRPVNPQWRASAADLFDTLTHLNEGLDGDPAINDPALFANAMNRQLDDILRSFSVESRRRSQDVK